MAKVRGAFGGFGTSQQIGKAYVLFVWKGINAIRTWVRPANPRSAGQVTQRNDFKALVQVWHGGSFVAGDITAWGRAASIVKYKPQSGFNRFIGLYRDAFYKLMAHIYLTAASCTSTAHAAASFTVAASAHAASNVATFYWGVHPSSMFNVQTPTYVLGYWNVGAFNTGLTAGVVIYWKYKIIDGVGMQEGETGIYKTTLT